jgi:hypothetical protein
MAAEVLQPAKNEKDLGCLETSPMVPATATAGWSSLPDDLVRRIADSFLSTNDVDCYVDLRAICRSWRSATDDPKNNRWDSRFRPRQWIILDDVSDTRHLLLNTATGRFLYKELPLLRDYYVVATTLGGFFVLADKSPPHAARVFNPLTGDIIHFTVPMPVELEVAVVLLFASSVPILSLFCDSSCKIYKAVPHSFFFFFLRNDGGIAPHRLLLHYSEGPGSQFNKQIKEGGSGRLKKKKKHKRRSRLQHA